MLYLERFKFFSVSVPTVLWTVINQLRYSWKQTQRRSFSESNDDESSSLTGQLKLSIIQYELLYVCVFCGF